MTEKLKTLLHERAAEPHFAVPDLDVLVRDGDRRIRRRRAASLAGGLAVLALVGGMTATQLGDGPGADSAQVATEPAAGRSVTWATGSVIHSAGGDAVDVGHEVAAYVETSTGFVVADGSGKVWSVRGGEVAEVGRTDARHPRLVADAEGPLAGWVSTTGEGPTFLVLDQSTGEVMSNGEATEAGMGNLADEQDPAYFYAIDGDTAYWRDQRGAVAVDLRSGDVRVIDATARNGFDILDVDHGVIAFNAGDDGTALGRTRADAVMLPEVYGSMGVFSPGGEYYSADADEPEVYDARTGQRVRFDLHHAFATGYEWLDAQTVVMLAQEKPSSSVQLLTCRVPGGSCEVAVDDLGSFDDLTSQGFAIPVGEHVGD